MYPFYSSSFWLVIYVAILNILCQSNLVVAVFIDGTYVASDRYRNYYECPPDFRAGPKRFCYHVLKEVGFMNDLRLTCKSKQVGYTDLGVAITDFDWNVISDIIKRDSYYNVLRKVFVGLKLKRTESCTGSYRDFWTFRSSTLNFMYTHGHWASDESGRKSCVKDCIAVSINPLHEYGFYYSMHCESVERGYGLCEAPKRDSCRGHKCAHFCIQTSYVSRQCECYPGYTLVNQTECVDIDECALGICDQKCNNTIGDFICSCRAGYFFNITSSACEDVNECDDPITHDIYMNNCNNLQGSYAQSCGEMRVVVDGSECRLRDNIYVPLAMTSMVISTLGTLICATVVVMRMERAPIVSTDDVEEEVDGADEGPEAPPIATEEIEEETEKEYEVDGVDLVERKSQINA